MVCKDFHSLLPSPTDHESALERTSREKYCAADPDIIRSLFEPMDCPVELLPWLAYALSVDVWNDRWPEETKRAVCANSLNVHLHKGTLGGVEHALSALGIQVEVVEWWEQVPEGEPGTMEVTLWVNEDIFPESDVLINAELTRDIIRQLESSKRVSIHYTFRLAVEAGPLSAGIAMSAQFTAIQRVEAIHSDVDSRSSQPVSLCTTASAQLSVLHRMDALHTDVVSRTRLPAQSAIAMSAQLSTLTRLEARI